MNEFDFIKRIRDRAAPKDACSSSLITHHSSLNIHHSPLLVGIGDDAAVIGQAGGRNTVITADLLVEDIDFERATMPPPLLGHKALAVSLSDIAAMGARPRWALLTIGLPTEIWDSDFVDEFYQGFFTLAKKYDVQLAGGDVSRTPDKIVIDSIVLGECKLDQAVLRRGARAGDQIFVTGELGGSAAGLRLLQQGARLGVTKDGDEDDELVQKLLLRHLCPEPRVGWGMILGQDQLATAMIDISDGLSSDLHHLCDESRSGALIDAARLPIDSLVGTLCGRRALDPLLLALHGGEDFELLFTVRPEHVGRLPKSVDGVSLAHIGTITDEPGRIRVAEKDLIWELEPKGFAHFTHNI